MRRVGRVALKTLVYFEVVTSIALVLALVAVNLWRPGAGMNVNLHALDTHEIAQYAAQAHAAHVVHAGHAVDHGAEDHRRDDHAHQGDEGVAERLHVLAELGPEPAQQDACSHADEHLEPELPEDPHQITRSPVRGGD